jgi:2-aminobenzoylacetyl-CoA thioesterase
VVFRTTGHVAKDLYVTGFAWSPAYLLAANPPLIFEAGFYCMGKLYERDIISALGERRPEMLFLTHVHYDHCGATSYLRRSFPGMRVAGSVRASEIIRRPNALRLMSTLSEGAIPLAAATPGVEAGALLREPFEPFTFDLTVKDKERLVLGPDLTVEVIATPGHTRDLVSYYIPERKILIATEAVGVQGQTGHIVSEFLIDYDTYMSSLRRLAGLEVDVLCQGHHFVYVGDDVRNFLERSMSATERFRERVEDLLKKEGSSVEGVVREIKKWEYDPNPGPKQPEAAYLLNLTTRVGCLAERLMKGDA